VTEIETDRLTIRRLKVDDWRDLQEMIIQYEASEVSDYDHAWPTSAKAIKEMATWFADGDSYLAVCLKTTHKLIGFIVLDPEEREGFREFSLGYIFNADYHGRGYATEGCRAVIAHAFGPLAADRVIAGTAAANERSCRLLTRLGMRGTGQSIGSLRRTQEGEPIEFLNLSFAISRAEWFRLRRAERAPAYPGAHAGSRSSATGAHIGPMAHN
jgi:RimJ/RimL family protein N-acetyltransferase